MRKEELRFSDRLKHNLWKRIYRFFPRIQRVLLVIRILRHENIRQRYHFGWLAPGKTLEELKKHLKEKWNFGNNFIAWIDEGQVLSWRKLVSFDRQYHLRVFCDGEIRGHFEFTPEAKPIAHFSEVGEEERREDFQRFLGDFITEKEHKSNLAVDPDMLNTKTQITIEDMELLN